jgi:uncharacterized membrane protein YqjE
MQTITGGIDQLTTSSKQFVRRLATVGENRLELLLVEVQEERERVVQAILLALGVAVFGLFAGLTLTAVIVVWFWAYSPAGVLVALTALYGGVGIFLYRRLAGLLHNWKTFPASIEQIQKDRVCLEKILA